jgi:VCBS repeat protein
MGVRGATGPISVAAVLGVALALGVVSPRAASQPDFVGPTDYATEDNPWAVWVADLNGDGSRDVLSVELSGTVSVLLGRGDGGLGRKRSYDVGDVGGALLDDLNGDARPDLVIANSEDETGSGAGILIRLSKGDGSFAAPRTYPTGGPIESLTSDDVDGDGRPDLVTANGVSYLDEDEDEDLVGTVSVLLNRGNGSFWARRDYELRHEPSELAVGDLNRDGRPDLVLANNDDESVSVLLGSGEGFRPARDYETVGRPINVAIRDLNGDGRPDLVTTSEQGLDEDAESGSVSVLLNRGDGSFLPRRGYAVGEGVVVLLIGDLNRDRKADLVTANTGFEDGAETVSVLVNIGDGSFRARRDYPTPGASGTIALADLDGDARPDLVTANTDSDSISVLLGNGDGGFQARRDFETGRGPGDVAIGDLNGDGRQDLVTGGDWPAVSVLLNTMGEGAPFVAPSTLFPHAREYAAGPGVLSVAAGDVNGDGRGDLVTANSGNRTVSVLLGREEGFGPKQDYDVGRFPRWVAIGDLNGDHGADLVVANKRDDTVSVLINRGNGRFGQKRDYETGRLPYAVVLRDLNGDGTLDVATADGGGINGTTVSVLLNPGDGTLRKREAYRTGRAPLSLAIGDVNGDGRPDLVTGNSLGGSVSVLLNLGHGGFGGRRDYRVGRFPRSVAIGDLNGDGAPDLAVANNRDASVSVLLNAGDGTFGAKHDYKTGPHPYSVVLGDFDGDGASDLVTGDEEHSTLRVLAGNSNGGFRDLVEFPIPVPPQFLATGDVDGDRKLDVVATFGPSVAVDLNRGP